MTFPWHLINDFLLHCGSKRSPLEFGRDILTRIDRLIPFDQGRFYLLDCSGNIEAAFCLGVDPAAESEYYDFYAKEGRSNYSTVSAAARFARQYPRVEQCVKTPASYDNGFFSEYIQPNHIIYSFGLGLRDTHYALRGMFSLDRVRDVAFSEDEIEIMRIVRPHLDNLNQNFFVELEKRSAKPPGGAALNILTRREREIADLLVKGVSPKNISARLSISPTTVDKHLANMHRKLQVGSRQELILKLLKIILGQ